MKAEDVIEELKTFYCVGDQIRYTPRGQSDWIGTISHIDPIIQTNNTISVSCESDIPNDRICVWDNGVWSVVINKNNFNYSFY